ncbi:MAG: gluconokinase [Alphaproteobacteria bacterium]|nr:gluconokinase [Alphaproteobacteria bacterium]
MGVSGSGKTTIGAGLAQRLGARFLESDRLHPPSNIAKMTKGEPLGDEDRLPWLQAIAAEIDRAHRDREKLVVACSALKRRYRDILTGSGHELRLVHLKGAPELVAARLAERRNHFMPPGLLPSQFAALEEPAQDERPIIVDISAAPATIVDRIVEELAVVADRG